jgi:preprotein translocase subunit SecA
VQEHMALLDRVQRAFIRARPTWQVVDRIAQELRSVRDLSDRQLTASARSWGFRLRSGLPIRQAQSAVFALAAEAIRRRLQIELYPVQLYGGLLLQRGVIVEMQTGEGKTVAAVAPVVLRALYGLGCHVMTSNEYLAARDADKLRPVYELLGLTVGCIAAEQEPDARSRAYRCDITYGTASEFGFDYLRDRLALPTDGGGRPVTPQGTQRGHYYALIDEADSLLLDDSRTPLIIALPTPEESTLPELLGWSRAAALKLHPERDYLFDPKHRDVHLTHGGCRRLLLMPRTEGVARYDQETLYQRVETALQAELAYHRDREYMLHDGELVIVDESTGRSLDGRKWQRGLHQAIELKEAIELTEVQGVAARITLQRYVKIYPHLAGMTGTAWSARHEFRRLYQRRVCRVPTHRVQQRQKLAPRVFINLAAKWAAVATAVAEERARGRPILIGTPSIRASDGLSRVLTDYAIPHRVLNARQDAEEAEIVAAAGSGGRVTIATNMAGRGTDILLDDAARSAGGLHVIATELHSSFRIDRQLIGRAARQGDPGSYQFLVSLEDELIAQVAEARRRRWIESATRGGQAELSSRRWLPVFRRVQGELERRHARDRKQSMKAEQSRWKLLGEMGLDPTLDLLEEE